MFKLKKKYKIQKSQNFIALAVPSKLNNGFKNPVSPKTMYAPLVLVVYTIYHGFLKKQTLPWKLHHTLPKYFYKLVDERHRAV